MFYKKKKFIKTSATFSYVVLVSSTWSFFSCSLLRKTQIFWIAFSYIVKNKNRFMCSDLIINWWFSCFFYLLIYITNRGNEKKPLFMKIVLKVLFYLPSKSVKNYHNYNREFGKTFMFYYVFLSYEWIYLCFRFWGNFSFSYWIDFQFC